MWVFVYMLCKEQSGGFWTWFAHILWKWRNLLLPKCREWAAPPWRLRKAGQVQHWAAAIFPETDSLLSLTALEPLLDPWKLEKENTSAHSILSREPSWSSFCVCCGYSFLVWSIFWLEFLINTLMELLMFHLTACLEIAFWKACLYWPTNWPFRCTE